MALVQVSTNSGVSADPGGADKQCRNAVEEKIFKEIKILNLLFLNFRVLRDANLILEKHVLQPYKIISKIFLIPKLKIRITFFFIQNFNSILILF